MKRWLIRFWVGVACALPMMLLGARLAEANPASAPPQDATITNCVVCHADFQTAWEHGAHGQAASNKNFLDSWKSQGSPAECMSCHATGYDANTGTWKTAGVTCEACHSPITVNHPQEPMPTDRTGKICGNCHTETYFEWQVSKHRQNNLTCSTCHDPHATQLKADNASDLCATCHQTMSTNFSHTQHSAKGLTCADCHLGKLTSPLGEGHGERDHSFNVRLDTCNQCHAYQMHDPAAIHEVTPTPAPLDSMTAVTDVPVTTEPQPVSPVGFATLSGLIGLAFGMVLAPWLERLYKRMK
jgi:predicted CXXCH cytochrome family protein